MSPPSLPPLEPGNPDLPVAAETVWTSGEGLSVTSRLAVHAVRRMPGATVLDWSVTPLRAPGYTTGDPLPNQFDLGLTREDGGGPDVVLLDRRRQTAFAPLTHRDRRFRHCLCSPLWVVQSTLRLGETRLLQVAFPPVPVATSEVDVVLANSVPFSRVPVSPYGAVPIATEPVDLHRPPPPESAPVAPRTVFATFPGSRQRLHAITINGVVASPDWTALSWTLTSVTDQPTPGLLPFGPPVAAPPSPEALVAGAGPADGPEIVVPGRPAGRLKTWYRTTRYNGEAAYECLCSDLGLWAVSLRQPEGRAMLVSLFPALPPGARTVDVALPTVSTIRGVAVQRVAPAAQASTGPAGDSPPPWTYRFSDPPPGWPASSWPVPLPATGQLRSYEAFPSRLAMLPGR